MVHFCFSKDPNGYVSEMCQSIKDGGGHKSCFMFDEYQRIDCEYPTKDFNIYSIAHYMSNNRSMNIFKNVIVLDMRRTFKDILDLIEKIYKHTTKHKPNIIFFYVDSSSDIIKVLLSRLHVCMSQNMALEEILVYMKLMYQDETFKLTYDDASKIIERSIIELFEGFSDIGELYSIHNLDSYNDMYKYCK